MPFAKLSYLYALSINLKFANMNHFRKKAAVQRYAEASVALTVDELRATLAEDDQNFTPEEIDEIVEALKAPQGEKAVPASTPTPIEFEPEDEIDQRLVAKPDAPAIAAAPKAKRAYPLFDLWKVDPSIDKNSRVTLELISITRKGVKINQTTADNLNAQAHNSGRLYVAQGKGSGGDKRTYQL